MKRIHSIYYHNPNVKGFEKMVCHYLRKGYRFIGLEELYDIMQGSAPFQDGCVFVSFDDGWRGNLRLIPVIEKYNVPICIFIATEPLHSGNFWWEYVKNEVGIKKILEFKSLPYNEFYSQLDGYHRRNVLCRSAMANGDVSLLSKHPLVSIQSHTVNHPVLTSVPDDVLEQELRESKKQLEELTGKDVYAFSYPNGSLTSREMEAGKRYYKIAFTTEQRHILAGDCIYKLPRYALTGDYSRDLLKVWGIWKYIKKIADFFRSIKSHLK